ncbi:MAG: hypothetical protein JXJ22_13775 [Bacteroidales bacterium]|nr:hypothetical protein [Bacteroidales bacterium]
MNKVLKILFLLFIPALLMLISMQVEKNRGNFWEDPDPDYCYLMNGLVLAGNTGKIGHIDHPGTPGQIIAGIIIKTVYTFRKTDQTLIIDVLSNPELYLRKIAWFFAAFNSLLIFLLGWTVLFLTHNLLYGLLFQSIPFTSNMLILHGFYSVTPEPLLVGATLFLIALCLFYIYGINDSGKELQNSKFKQIIKTNIWPFLFGSVIAFSIATKIYSAPVILIPLFILKGRRDIFYFVLYSILFFVLFTLPIFNQYKAFSAWVLRLFIHKGFYGHGAKGLLDFQAFFQNIIIIIKGYPILCIVLIFSIVVLVVRLIKGDKSNEVKVLTAFIIFQILEVAVIAKQFYIHYVIPVIPGFTLTFFLSVSILNIKQRYKKILISLFILTNLILVSTQLKYLVENKTEQNTQDQNNNNFNGFTEIYCYGCSSPFYALDFGNYYSNRSFGESLNEIYKNKYFYDIWNRIFHDWNGDTVYLNDLYKRNPNLVLKGRKSVLKNYTPDFSLKFINKDINDNFLICPKSEE